MKRILLAVAVLAAVVAVVSVVFLQNNSPDASSAPAYAPYARLPYDLAPSWSRDGSQILFCRFEAGGEEDSLWIVPASGGVARKFLDGAALPAWSPDGKSVAFSSSRGVKWYDPRRFVGGKPIHLWIADANGQNLRKLTTAPEDDLDAAWSPDGQEIAFTAFPGPRVMVVPAGGGNPQHLADGLSPAWSPDGKRIAYYSCDASNQAAPCELTITSLDGAQKKTLHSVVDPLSSFGRPTLDWSADGKRLLSTRLEQGNRIPVVIDIENDRLEKSIQEPGSVISARWSPDGERVAYSFMNTAHPADIEVKDFGGGERRQLTSGPRYNGAQLVRYGSDGDLQIPAWLYVPPKPAPARPAIVWLHGGAPGTSCIPNQFDAAIQYFVDAGFVVLAPNYRGSIGFEEVLAKAPQGMDPLPDIVAAVRYLKTVDTVDPTRIALVGFSFGGFLTLHAITEQPDLVSAAVDFFGPSDWAAYYRDNPGARSVLTSLLGGTPEQRPNAYRALSPIYFVDRIQIPLLVLCGTRDPNYHEVTELAKALERHHGVFEYITYRFAGHGFRGADDANANQQTMRFLLTHLRWAR